MLTKSPKSSSSLPSAAAAVTAAGEPLAALTLLLGGPSPPGYCACCSPSPPLLACSRRNAARRCCSSALPSPAPDRRGSGSGASRPAASGLPPPLLPLLSCLARGLPPGEMPMSGKSGPDGLRVGGDSAATAPPLPSKMRLHRGVEGAA